MQIRSLFLCICTTLLFGLSTITGQIYIEGYTFESGNRGFLSQVTVNAENAKTGEFLKQVVSDNDGKFVFDFAPGVSSVKLIANKDLFHEFEMIVGPAEITDGKAYLKMQMTRKPGYIFEITLAEKSDSIGLPTNHISDALIEVYNNTKEEVVMVLEDHPQPDFKVNMSEGNHYTVMIRKKGYLTKRMEAFVNVEGCILCFEGVGEITPGVTDNLSDENKMGTLLANVELEPIFEGKSIQLQNIYYDYGKATIRKDAKVELDKAATFLNDNPQITVELGSHTDSRGTADKNMDLSGRRAQSAVDYLVKKGGIERFRITARGYGESDLAVKCGSECTEAEHARNRRSEIKIVGIAKDIPYKSLEKIKYEENFDNIIAALQEEGQVKIPEDAKLPEDLKAEISDDSEKEKLTDEADKLKEKVKETGKEVKGKAQTSVPEGTAIIEKPMEKVIDTPEVAEMKKVVVEEAQEKVNMTKTVEPEMATEKAQQGAKEKSTMATRASDAVDNEMVKAKQTINSVDTNEVKSGENYTGHKVVVAFRRAEIDDSDELFKSFDELSAYKANAGYYLYMVGDFETKSDADAYLQTIIGDHPNAYLVEFDNGNRVN